MKRILSLAVVVFSVIAAMAQSTESPIVVSLLTYRHTTKYGYVEIRLKEPVARELVNLAGGDIEGGTLKVSNVTLAFIDASGEKHPIPGSHSIEMVDDEHAQIRFPGSLIPDPGTAVKVELTFEQELSNTASTTMRFTGVVESPAVVAANLQKTIEELNKDNQVDGAKNPFEKDLLAAFAVSVPSKGDSEGAADIAINRSFGQYNAMGHSLINQLVVGLALKKGSATGTDSRHFSAGFAARSDVLIGNHQWRDVRRVLSNPNSSIAQRNAALEEVTDPAKRKPVFFSALLVDNGLQFEGDVKGVGIGNVSNLYYSMQTQLVSPTWFARGVSTQMTLVPAAFELGYNLQNTDFPQMDGSGIARYRNGGTFRAFYDASDIGPIRRFEFVFQGVSRQLFSMEAAVDPTTQAVTKTTSGNKYYLQGDFKVFFASTSKGRPGFRVSFKRGTLPPAYTFTKGFEFGIIFETSDDTQTNQPK